MDGYDPDSKANVASPAFTGVITLPSAADPTTDAEGEISVDTGVWGNAGIDAIEFFDGTQSTYLVGVDVTDTPTDGQVLTWNTGGLDQPGRMPDQAMLPALATAPEVRVSTAHLTAAPRFPFTMATLIS